MGENNSSVMRSRGLRTEETSDERFMKNLKLETTIKSSPPFIFQLPEFVCNANPDVFLSHLITLGPHNRNNNMDSYKLYMAKNTQEKLHLPPFDQLCCQLKPLELRIRACYSNHFEIDGDRLVRIMLIDALFLLGLFLNIKDQMLPSKNLLMKDVVKLENQIPIMVLKSILQRPDSPDVSLPALLYHFGKSVSPVSFGPPDVCSKILNQSHHLIHFMYMAILISPQYVYIYELQSGSFSLALTFSQKWFRKLGCVVEVIESIHNLFGLIKNLFERKQNDAHKSTSSVFIPSASQLHKLPFNFKITYRGILYAKFIKHPGTEIQHVRTRNGIREVQVQLPPTLNLPQITVNAYTETVLENLLAFEAIANINPPVFARYLQLMKALIKTPKDLNILKEEKIIKTTHDDEQVVKLFNRVGNYSISSINKNNNPITTNDDLHRSFQPKNEIFEMMNENYEKGLKGMVEEINQCYEGFWIVRAKRYLKKLWIYVVKMVTILQIFVVLGKLVNSIIGNDVDDDEPIYQIPPT